MTHNEMPKDTVKELTVEASFALIEAIKKFQVSRDHNLDVDKVLRPFLQSQADQYEREKREILRDVEKGFYGDTSEGWIGHKILKTIAQKHNVDLSE